MKILFDHQIFQMQTVGGISRYFCEILGRLSRGEGLQVELALKYSGNQYLGGTRFSGQIEAASDTYDRFLPDLKFRGKWSLYNLRNRLRPPTDSAAVNKRLSIEALQKQDFDVFHPTYYDDYFLPYLGNKPFVLTVYDMIHEIYPEHFSLTDRTSEQKRNLAEKASKIIAISERTKKDLVCFFQIPAEKIQVVHLADAMDSSFEESAGPADLPNRFILFVGARSGYKNFFFFLNAVISLLASDPTLHLVCAGSPFGIDELALFDRQGIASQMHCYSVNDAELHTLYGRALVFVFPSLYEGFGLPVLEAFSSSCPTILSNAGSLPEIGGEGALYFEPKDGRSLNTAIRDVIYNENRRAELIEGGKNRLRLFSWDKTASETGTVYCEVHDRWQHR